jgi:Phytanoyl-CoA dioxygenase (PhyH)
MPMYHVLKRKFASFQRDPVGCLKLRMEVCARSARHWYHDTCPRMKFRWPIYDVWRYFLNREATKLYRLEKARVAPGPLQQKVINELEEKGISIVHFSDLFPHCELRELQKSAEMYVQKPANHERILAIERGAMLAAKNDKFYLVRLLGDLPVFDQKDKFVELSLSNEVLGIVCGYLRMLGRLGFMDLWYNAPTHGPQVSSQRWHRDPDDRKQVKLFLYLRDVNETNGPFCYIPETHNGGRFRKICPQGIHTSNYPPDDFVDKTFPRSLRQTCVGVAGTLIFCDTTGFHRGGDPIEGARLLFNAVYTTNAGVPVVTKEPYYFISSLHRDALDPVAQYAVGHLEETAGDRHFHPEVINAS